MTASPTPSGDFDPKPYLAAGIPADELHTWWKWRLSADEAKAWRAAGVLEPIEAAQWATAKVTHETVNAWLKAGITAAESITWHEYGFSLEDAAKYKQQGHTADQAFDVSRGRTPQSADDDYSVAPGDALSGLMSYQGGGAQDETQRFISKAGASDGMVMYSYINENWLDNEAIAWARHNIDAATARIWKDLGLRPAEAGRFIRRGLSPMAVARTWWQANIPFDEAPSWIGAGLTPEETIEQRANGVTAEQAETLRTLRNEERFD